MAKEGSTLSGMMDAFATSISLALQYGVPLRDLVNKFSHMRFEPSGRTENREIPVAQSIVDYIFRWLASQFLSEEEKEEFGVLSPAVKAKLMAQEYDAAGLARGTAPATTPQRPDRRAALRELRLDHDPRAAPATAATTAAPPPAADSYAKPPFGQEGRSQLGSALPVSRAPRPRRPRCRGDLQVARAHLRSELRPTGPSASSAAHAAPRHRSCRPACRLQAFRPATPSAFVSGQTLPKSPTCPL